MLGNYDSDSDWDHDAYPLTQLSEQGGTLQDALEGGGMTYREQAYGALASSAGSKTSQDLSGTCNPFVSGGTKSPAARKGKKRAEPTPDLPGGFICNQKIPLKVASNAMNYLKCDGCQGTFHRGCAGFIHEPRYNSFRCPLGCVSPREARIYNMPAKHRA